jgi:hypothetical protein
MKALIVAAEPLRRGDFLGLGSDGKAERMRVGAILIGASGDEVQAGDCLNLGELGIWRVHRAEPDAGEEGVERVVELKA